MYFIKTPFYLKILFPKRLWKTKTKEKKIYLTFDDGPIPEVTLWVLQQLEKFEAKATFFCIGENVVKNKSIFQKILEAGHAVGNHTHNHLNGWKTDKATYLENVEKCENTFFAILFRPPYGRLTQKQAGILNKKFKIVMWDVLSGDFDKSISKEKCLENVLKNADNGSIIVFHDSLKAENHLRYVLPKVLQYFKEKEFVFEKL